MAVMSYLRGMHRLQLRLRHDRNGLQILDETASGYRVTARVTPGCPATLFGKPRDGDRPLPGLSGSLGGLRPSWGPWRLVAVVALRPVAK